MLKAHVIEITKVCVAAFMKAKSFLVAIYKIQERGRECGECEERGECSLEFWGISYRIPGNVVILLFRGMLKKIPGNVPNDSGECF